MSNTCVTNVKSSQNNSLITTEMLRTYRLLSCGWY